MGYRFPIVLFFAKFLYSWMLLDTFVTNCTTRLLFDNCNIDGKYCIMLKKKEKKKRKTSMGISWQPRYPAKNDNQVYYPPK